MSAVSRVSPAQAEEIARRHYGVDGSAERLSAEFDDAFRLVAGDSSWFVKVGLADGAACAASTAVSFQTAVLLHLAEAAPGLPVQRVVPALDGRPEVSVAGNGHHRLVRMTSWLDGELLSRADNSPELRRDLGATLAKLSVALRRFSHPGALRTHRWDLQHLDRLRGPLADLPGDGVLPEVAAALGTAVPSGVRAGLEDYLDRFESVLRPRLAAVPVQVIHTDFHGENLLCDGARITGILDFGDALTGPVAMDVAVAACYQLGRGPDVLGSALDVVAGYHGVDPLAEADLELIAGFLVGRVAARIILSQWHAMREPSNQGYLLRRTPQAIELFAALRLLTPEDIVGRLRAVLSA
ncbi:aminoglycoside phosphotransferase [Trebonia kvetii]|uniref:Hydroxylysine kinase n=1 Tax=Trebonia kvetii TaxID=2480626 RepID=A0A6P2BPC9_9ACTN|nr:phosphotransferase [Trebonia kvetii]TVZ00810.1 aminoglycoside phosphotransferase [Trebonia kvetii]